MLNTKPNLSPVYATFAVVSAGAFLQIVGVDYLSGLIALLLVCFGAFAMIDWFLQRLVESRVRIIRESQEELRIAELLMRMPADVLAALQESRIIRRHVLAWGEVRHTWLFPSRLGDMQEFSSDDVRAVWGVCTPTHFAPISTWGDQTTRRNCALAMYNRFSGYGWLTPPAGNQSARWIGNGYEKARQALWED